MSRKTSTGERSSTDPPDVDTDLVERIARGDRLAETTLVRRYQRAVSLLLRQRVPLELASDLTQETLIIVLDRVRSGGITDPERLAGFVRMTAINLAINERRKSSRRRTDGDPAAINDALEAEHRSPHALVEEQDLARLTRELLKELPIERDRDLLQRYLVQGESKSDCMAAHGLSSVEHFDRVLHRARVRLRELLEKRLDAQTSHGSGQHSRRSD